MFVVCRAPLSCPVEKLARFLKICKMGPTTLLLYVASETSVVPGKVCARSRSQGFAQLPVWHDIISFEGIGSC